MQAQPAVCFESFLGYLGYLVQQKLPVDSCCINLCKKQWQSQAWCHVLVISGVRGREAGGSRLSSAIHRI